MSIVLVKVEFSMVRSCAPALIVPPMPVMRSRVKPPSPEPRLTFIWGAAPSAARMVICLPTPDQVP